MSRGVNKVVLVGNLGADPDVKYTQSGAAICTLKLATSEQWKDKESGEKQERTEWHRVKLFGKLGEIAGEYLKKGKQVYIEGSIRTDKYTDKEGIERYATDIIASEMQMLGSASDNDRSDNSRSESRASNGSGNGHSNGSRAPSAQGNREQGGGGYSRAGGSGGRGAAPAPPPSRGASEPAGRNDARFEDDDVPF